MRRRFIGAALVLTAALTGCGSAPENVIEGRGTVRYVDLEGGFYAIMGDGGKKFMPLNLEEAYRKEGLRVSFRARRRDDLAFFHQWGIPVELTFIKHEEGRQS